MTGTGLGMGATAGGVDWPHVIRRLRLGSGLILFSYVSTHLINHGFGVLSLDAMEMVRRGFTWVWRLPPMTTALYGAITVHIALAMWSIYRRRSLRMQPWEAAQLLLGLSIPPLLLVHVLGTRIAHELYGLQDTYAYVLLVQWVFSPHYALQQVAVLLIAWLHGCIGLHFWLRLRPWYPRALPYLYSGALLVPVVALIGYAVAGRAVLLMSMDPAWTRRAAAAIRFPPGSAVEAIERNGAHFVAVVEHDLSRKDRQSRPGFASQQFVRRDMTNQRLERTGVVRRIPDRQLNHFTKRLLAIGPYKICVRLRAIDHTAPMTIGLAEFDRSWHVLKEAAEMGPRR